MTWDRIQQLIRIVAYMAGSGLFGSEVASGDLFTAAIGGIVSVGAFAWWWFWERKREPAPVA